MPLTINKINTERGNNMLLEKGGLKGKERRGKGVLKVRENNI